MKFEAVIRTEKVWVFPIEADSTEEARFKADAYASKVEPTQSKRNAQVYQTEEYEPKSINDMDVVVGCGCGGNCSCGKEH